MTMVSLIYVESHIPTPRLKNNVFGPKGNHSSYDSPESLQEYLIT